MGTRLPTLKAADVARILEQLSFVRMRQSGSHVFFQHPDGRTTLVPYHGGKDIGRGLLRQIIREAGLTPEEFSRIRGL
ncbi:type II toxin-antitoxin system HicA family toxin [Candidatus Uhrbacteria bacterium]|nr:type II toxin-antitoxin system HicA family toxin [Candidatus Uhrbacteria bacterium]